MRSSWGGPRRGLGIVAIASSRDVYEHSPIADIELSQSERQSGRPRTTLAYPRVAAHIDASSEKAVAELARAVAPM